MRLVDRRAERAMLDRLMEAVCAGESRTLVLCGEPGVGKTALLQYLIGRAAECRVVQIAGVEWEMELAFAGLPQLCAPLPAGREDLPARPHLDSFEAAQRTALRRHPTATATAPATTAGGMQIAINTANLSLVVGAAVTLDELSRVLAEHGVSCQAIPAESTQRTVGELIANPNNAERQAVRHALLGPEVVLPDGQALRPPRRRKHERRCRLRHQATLHRRPQRLRHHLHRHLQDLHPRRLGTAHPVAVSPERESAT